MDHQYQELPGRALSDGPPRIPTYGDRRRRATTDFIAIRNEITIVIVPARYRGHRGSEARMKLHYYPETDSLYIDLKNVPSAESREISDGLVVDFDVAGDVVGIDIDHASKKLDLRTVETEALPTPVAKLA